MNELAASVADLVTKICASFFDQSPTVLRSAANAPSPLWARVAIAGTSLGDVWVSPSEALARRILQRGFGSNTDNTSELREATHELCNILAGNLKALLPGPSQLGFPMFHPSGPARPTGGEQRFEFTVDGEPLVVLLQLGS